MNTTLITWSKLISPVLEQISYAFTEKDTSPQWYSCWKYMTWIESWRKQWHPTPVLLPGKSHGQRSLVGCSPWGCKGLDMTERLLSLFTFVHWRRKWQLTPVFLPRESQGWGSLVGPSMGLHRVRHNWSDLAAEETLDKFKLRDILWNSLNS